MLELTSKDNFVLGDNIFLHKIDELEKYWVFNIDTGEHYTLNGTSYWILERISEGVQAEELFSAFIAEYDVDEKLLSDDFNEIISNFLEERIIERRKNHE